MKFWIYFGIYTLSMLIIWGFFIIAKIHSLKFKNYQPKIIKITGLANIVLGVLTIIGFILVFFFSGSSNTYDIRERVVKDNITTKQDNFSDISEKDNIIPDNAGEDYY